MSVESYIQAMPKVDLGVTLEGAVRKATWLLIAEQNEIAASTKHFDKSLKLLEEPDYTQLDKLIEMLGSWIRYPEDLVRLVYDVGVTLAKQNVKYAEVCVNVVNCMPASWTFDDFITALSDGRDRVERGWGVRLNWILTVPRAEPRRADDTLRWVVSATGRKNGVIGFGVVGDDTAQPAGQFERAFNTARKKEAKSVLQVGTEGILEAVQALHPDRLIDAWGIVEDEQSLELIKSEHIPVSVSLSRVPIRQLLDNEVDVILNADMSQIYHVDLNQVYLTAVEQHGLTIDELENLALNAIRNSFLNGEDKGVLLDEFRSAYQALRQEHLQSEAE
jgi:adenosine deaminase